MICKSICILNSIGFSHKKKIEWNEVCMQIAALYLSYCRYFFKVRLPFLERVIFHVVQTFNYNHLFLKWMLP